MDIHDRIARSDQARAALTDLAEHIIAVYRVFVDAGLPTDWAFTAAQALVVTAAEWGVYHDDDA